MKTKAANGYALIYALLLLLIAGIVGFTGWYVYHSSNTTNSIYSNSGNVAANSKPADRTNTTGSATLTGTVSQGPAAPVCQSFATCSNPVINHTIEASDSSGKVVASAETDSKGQYTLRLDPGTYTLNLNPKIGLGVIKNNQVTVHSGTNTFDLDVDSGIR